MPSDYLFKLVNAIHRPLFKATKGKIAGKGLGMPVLVLTTIGRKSGERRERMLTSPLQIDGSIVLVASRGGDDRNPAWYHNLVADPAVEVELDGTKRSMKARIPDAAERSDLWGRIIAAHDNYEGYQRKTERQIPLVVLDPS